MAERVLDVHAHITPAGALRAMQSGDAWYGVSAPILYNQHRYNPRTFWTPEQRIADMMSLGVDVHVLSTNANMYFYELDAQQALEMHRECNDYVAELVTEYPERFAGLANLPMQDVGAAIEELTRSVEELGLKGAMIGDHVNGRTFDDPGVQSVVGDGGTTGGHVPGPPGGRDGGYAAAGSIPPAQHHRQSGRPHRHVRLVCFRRRDGPIPRSEDLPVPRRRIRMLRNWAHGSRLAGASRGSRQHQSAAQRLPEPF